jgi:hypothetical protein
VRLVFEGDVLRRGYADYPGMPGRSDDQPAAYRAEVRYADGRWFVVGVATTADLARQALCALEGSWDNGHLPIQTRIVEIRKHDAVTPDRGTSTPGLPSSSPRSASPANS